MGRVNPRREVNSADSQVSIIPSAYQPHPRKHPRFQILQDSPSPGGLQRESSAMGGYRHDGEQHNQSGDPAAVIKTAYCFKVDTFVTDRQTRSFAGYLVDAEQAN